MPKKQKSNQGGATYQRRISHGKDKQIRKALRRQRHAAKFLDENDKSFVSLNIQLQAKGLKLKQIMGDGNCLFRALADQFEQDHSKHRQYRQEVCQYILQNAPDFRPFVEDEMTLENFIDELSKDGVFGGNETLVAFARLHNVDIVIHQLDEPPWVIHANLSGKAAKINLHLAYHNDEDHYSSVHMIQEGMNVNQQAVKLQSLKVQSACNIKFDAQQNSKKRLYFDEQAYSYPTQTIAQQSKFTEQSEFNYETVAEFGHECNSCLAQVIAATGCQDSVTVLQALEDNYWDVSGAIAQVLQISQLGIDVDEQEDSVFDLYYKVNLATEPIVNNTNELDEPILVPIVENKTKEKIASKKNEPKSEFLVSNSPPILQHSQQKQQCHLLPIKHKEVQLQPHEAPLEQETSPLPQTTAKEIALSEALQQQLPLDPKETPLSQQKRSAQPQSQPQQQQQQQQQHDRPQQLHKQHPQAKQKQLSSTPSKVHNDMSNNNPKISNKKRKELAKIDRKARREETRKNVLQDKNDGIPNPQVSMLKDSFEALAI